MRIWRVGTFSMGASLVFLGLCLSFSRFWGLDLVHVMTSWWPIILVVLGCEILVYLFLSKQEKPVLRYDFLSIFLVGIIGTAGIIFTILSSTGLMGKAEEVMARKELTFELPDYSYQTGNSIKRVVVKTTNYQIMTIESTDEKKVSMFGTYQIQTAKKEKLIKSVRDYIVENTKGDTLYLNMKALPKEVGPFDEQGNMAVTLLVPDHVKLEVMGSDNEIILKPRMLLSDWMVDHASTIHVDVAKNSNLKVTAVGAEEIDGEWKGEKKASGSSAGKNAVYQSGNGKHQIDIAHSYEVSLNMN